MTMLIVNSIWTHNNDSFSIGSNCSKIEAWRLDPPHPPFFRIYQFYEGIEVVIFDIFTRHVAQIGYDVIPQLEITRAEAKEQKK